MIEVEAKVKISSPAGIRKKIREIGKYRGKERKVDDYYTTESLSKYPKQKLRVRKRKGFCEVNFKQSLSYVKGVHAKNEEEFRVSNLRDFLELISVFGFKKWMRKEKTTELYEITKNFHVEINNVKGLGWFLEVEYLCSEKEVKRARAEVLNVIKKLGIDKKDFVKDGYTKMLWAKRRK